MCGLQASQRYADLFGSNHHDLKEFLEQRSTHRIALFLTQCRALSLKPKSKAKDLSGGSVLGPNPDTQFKSIHYNCRGADIVVCRQCRPAEAVTLT